MKYILLLLLAMTLAIELPIAAADEARNQRRAAALKQMRTLAEETKIDFLTGSGEIALVEKPVFRYDDQPRHLLDATVWTWTSRGRPVAFQKIETMDTEVPLWQYCFASLSEERLKVKWSEGRQYESTAAGVTFAPAEDAPAVAAKSAERRRQLRELSRAYSARILLDSRSGDSQEMRLLNTPIFEFDDEESKVLGGAVFGYSTNGTNPDLLIVFEARPHRGKTVWQIAPVPMTISGIDLKHAEKTVWERPHVEPGKNVFPTWTYFQVYRKTLLDQPAGSK